MAGQQWRKRRAIEIVQRLLAETDADEDEHDGLLRELETLVPDPRVSDLIYWPDRHPLGRELAESGGGAEVIVNLATRYVPFRL